MLVCVFYTQFAHETAGAARTRSSLRPLTFRGRKPNAKLRAHRAASVRPLIQRVSRTHRPSAEDAVHSQREVSMNERTFAISSQAAAHIGRYGRHRHRRSARWSASCCRWRLPALRQPPFSPSWCPGASCCSRSRSRPRLTCARYRPGCSTWSIAVLRRMGVAEASTIATMPEVRGCGQFRAESRRGWKAKRCPSCARVRVPDRRTHC